MSIISFSECPISDRSVLIDSIIARSSDNAYGTLFIKETFSQVSSKTSSTCNDRGSLNCGQLVTSLARNKEEHDNANVDGNKYVSDNYVQGVH